MRNISLSLAALALVLGGSLASVANANERQFADWRADRATAQTSYIQSQAKSETVVSDASAGVYDSTDKFRDSTGHPLSGWQNVIYGGPAG